MEEIEVFYSYHVELQEIVILEECLQCCALVFEQSTPHNCPDSEENEEPNLFLQYIVEGIDYLRLRPLRLISLYAPAA